MGKNVRSICRSQNQRTLKLQCITANQQFLLAGILGNMVLSIILWAQEIKFRMQILWR